MIHVAVACDLACSLTSLEGVVKCLLLLLAHPGETNLHLAGYTAPSVPGCPIKLDWHVNLLCSFLVLSSFTDRHKPQQTEQQALAGASLTTSCCREAGKCCRGLCILASLPHLSADASVRPRLRLQHSVAAGSKPLAKDLQPPMPANPFLDERFRCILGDQGW